MADTIPRTKYKEGDAKILQICSVKNFSENHKLYFEMYRTSLAPNCTNISDKLFPIVIRLLEFKDDEFFSDFYSFDHNGVLLSHGYSRRRGDQTVIDEKHDMSLERLVEHGGTIKEMIDKYAEGRTNWKITMQPTYCKLANNSLKK